MSTLNELFELVRELLLPLVLRDPIKIGHLSLERGARVDIARRELSDVRLQAVRLVPEALIRPLIVTLVVVALILHLDTAISNITFILVAPPVRSSRALHEFELYALPVEIFRVLPGLSHIRADFLGAPPRAVSAETVAALAYVE